MTLRLTTLRLLAATVSIVLGAGVLTATGASAEEDAASQDWAAYVDPMIGTVAPGFVVPGAVVPFGMVQNSPDTQGETSPVAYTGYLYNDATIRGFSLVHQSGPGVPMGGNLPFLPVTGPVLSTRPTAYAVPFSHAAESAEAGAYGVRLGNGVDVDLAATPRAALQRYAFPPGVPATVVAAVGRANTGTHPASVQVVGADRLEGSVTEADNRGGPFTVHFSAQFSQPFTSVATYVGERVGEGSRAAAGEDAGALLRFAPGSTVTMRVGISYVDVDGARANLAAELPSYDVEKVQAAARAAWNAELDRVRVTGGTDAERTSFYTSLYRSFVHPNVFNDVDGRYRGTDDRVHTSERTVYENFSSWDTIRSQNQLLAMLQPARYRDMVASLVEQGRQSGALPRWSLHHTKPNFMSGDPAIHTVVDGYCRGALKGLDMEAIYADLRRLAFDQRRRDYLELGWIPMENAGKAASDTLEYAHADFALAVLAERLGHRADAEVLAKRAGSWANLFNPKTRFLQPRKADGSFDPSFHPADDKGWKEGNAWQHLWLAPHDLQRLSELLGGREATIARLDEYFSEPLTSAVPGAVPLVANTSHLFGTQYKNTQHNPGNEHDLQAPYTYSYVGQPWKTQGVLRSIQQLFAPTPAGLPGNDDLGSLTSWYVFSAMGFSPVTMGAPVNVVAAPVFPAVSLQVGERSSDRRFTVQAPGASLLGRYVQKATLDGKPLDAAWFGDSDIRAGGVLRLEMGTSPNKAWAAEPQSAPPSLTADGLAAFGCNPPGLASRH